MNKHTPGPWFATDRGSNLTIATKPDKLGGLWKSCAHTFIYVETNPYIDVGITAARANANLVIAAPEMLSALKLWHEWFDERDGSRYVNTLGEFQGLLAASRIARAKATGEPW